MNDADKSYVLTQVSLALQNIKSEHRVQINLIRIVERFGEPSGSNRYPAPDSIVDMVKKDLALDKSVSEVAQCCMCGKHGLSTVEGDGGTECQLSDGRWTCSADCYYTGVDLLKKGT